MFFASRKYIDTSARRRTAEELTKHRLVLQIADQTASKEMFDSSSPGSRSATFW